MASNEKCGASCKTHQMYPHRMTPPDRRYFLASFSCFSFLAIFWGHRVWTLREYPEGWDQLTAQFV